MEEPKYHLSGVMRGRDEVSGDFDGPLDLILLLLSKNKIEIQDVSISSILEQYLAYLDEMKRMDMEIASEFIDMASHLMLIKTKMLLSAAEQQEALSEMEQLIQSEEMLAALAAIEDRGQKRLPPPVSSFEGIVGHEPYPVTKKSAEILRKLLLRGISKLKRLFSGSRSRSEIVATFLAVLELCKNSSVELIEERGEPAVKLIRVPEEGKEASHGA